MNVFREYLLPAVLSLASACMAVVGYGFTTGRAAGVYETRLATLERQYATMQVEQEKFREVLLQRLEMINNNLTELRTEERILHRGAIAR